MTLTYDATFKRNRKLPDHVPCDGTAQERAILGAVCELYGSDGVDRISFEAYTDQTNVYMNRPNGRKRDLLAVYMAGADSE